MKVTWDLSVLPAISYEFSYFIIKKFFFLMAKGLNKHYTKEDIWMANMHIKIFNIINHW